MSNSNARGLANGKIFSEKGTYSNHYTRRFDAKANKIIQNS